MESPANPLLLQLKQLFLLYLYGAQGCFRLENLLAHFKDFSQEEIPSLEMMLGEKSRTYLMNGVQRFEEFLKREDIPAFLDTLSKWHIRCRFVRTYFPDYEKSPELLNSLNEYFFLQDPTLPDVQAHFTAFAESAAQEIEELNKANEELEAVRQEQNEKIYEMSRDLFPEK